MKLHEVMLDFEAGRTIQDKNGFMYKLMDEVAYRAVSGLEWRVVEFDYAMLRLLDGWSVVTEPEKIKMRFYLHEGPVYSEGKWFIEGKMKGASWDPTNQTMEVEYI